MDDEPDQPPLSTLRRHNSISTPVQIPAKLTLLITKPLPTATTLPNGNASSPPLDLELISLKTSLASYTSLRDILSSSAVAINSPTAAGSATNSGYEISIRNRLVKQAAIFSPCQLPLTPLGLIFSVGFGFGSLLKTPSLLAFGSSTSNSFLV